MRYAGLNKNDFADGSGVCVSFWVQGCPHKCPGCHNPQTWNFNEGEELPRDILKQIDEAIHANGIKRNFSVLGGEPLCPENVSLTFAVVDHVRIYNPDILIYIWTGYTLEQLKELPIYEIGIKPILERTDVLIDGPYIAEQRDITLPLRGSRNQRILYKGKDF